MIFRGELETGKGETRESGLEWTEAKSVLHTPYVTYFDARNYIICETNTSNALLEIGIVFHSSSGTHV